MISKSSFQSLTKNFVRFHSSVKDVYKAINYQAPFSEDDKAFILKRINDSQSVQEFKGLVAKPKADKIFQHKEQHGSFKVLEEILDVNGMEPVTLERFCKFVLKSTQKDAKEKKNDQVHKSYQKWIRPSMKTLKDVEVNSIVGMKFTLEGIAYAEIDANEDCNSLKSWKFMPPEKSLMEKSSFEHPELIDNIRAIIADIPKCDLIVYELPTRILPRDPKITVKMKMKLLETASLALLDSYQPGAKIHSMRSDTINKMYGLKVGEERILISNKALDVLQNFAPNNDEVRQVQFHTASRRTDFRRKFNLTLL